MTSSLPDTYNYIVYSSTPNYYAISTSTGNPIPNGVGSDPGPVIQAALDQADTNKNIYIKSGYYFLPNSFTGFRLNSNTNLILDQTTFVIVPHLNNHVDIFKLEGSNGMTVRNSSIQGGVIQEQGAGATKNWTAIKFSGIDSGILLNKFSNIEITNAGIGIELSADGNSGGWVKSNLFQFLKINTVGQAFIKFGMNGPYQFPPTGTGTSQNQTGIHKNHFENIECQSDSNVQYGITDVMHFGNFFFDVKIWDFSGTRIANIHQDARDTIIVGGIMTSSNPSVFPTPQPNTNTLILDPIINATIDPSVYPRLVAIQQDRAQYYNV